MQVRTHRGQSAFTLLELSIVLVIIGLIVGGITVGADMIRAAEVRGTIAQVQQYKAAVYTFKDKYFYLPGDMPNAYDFWGTEASCTDVHSDSDSAGCNGDGNNQITYNGGEAYRMWQHLQLSGLVEGEFSGIRNIAPSVPDARINPGVVMFQFRSNLRGNVFELAGRNSSGGMPVLSLFTPQEAWTFDKKVDDGVPHRGEMYSWGGYDGSSFSTTCFDMAGVTYLYPTTTAAINYNLTLETVECRLLWTVY